jgi:hypothetical protein
MTEVGEKGVIDLVDDRSSEKRVRCPLSLSVSVSDDGAITMAISSSFDVDMGKSGE